MLKIGVVGAGHFGRYHINCLKQSKVYDLVGFYDINNETIVNIKDHFGVHAFKTLDDLIKSVDVVDIVTPATTHYDCIINVLKNSRHAFVEKPLTTTFLEAQAIYELSDKNKVKIQIGHIERFNPAFLAALPYFNTPVQIDIKRFGTYSPRNKDVSVLEDLMIHDLDIICHVIKSPVKNIEATGFITQSDQYDIIDANLEFENGCIVKVIANRVAENGYRTAKFLQKDSLVMIDFLKKETKVIFSGNGMLNIDMELNENLYPGHKIISPPIIEINAMMTELETFHDSIINNTEPLVPVRDSLEVFKIIDLIKKKLK
jgi:predicted dehydrogenase